LLRAPSPISSLTRRLDTNVTYISRRFRYFADPLVICCLIVCPINRFYWKPHHIGGWFTHGYLNDVMCLPLFVPISLYLQRQLEIRKHDGYPRLWEIFQHWLIFTLVFQVIMPRFPNIFRGAGDPWDILAYLIGGVIGAIYWGLAACGSHRSLKRNPPGETSADALAPVIQK
jgi:hypothetical protein